MYLLLVGLNHTTAPVELRERLAFDAGQVEDRVQELASKAGLYEAVLLSTCNRTELYGTAISVHARDRMEHALATVSGVETPALDPYLYRFQDRDAVEHLYRVAAGLDSLVVGEPQILGQVREAFEHAHDVHVTGARLSKLFLTAVEVGKTVRSTTGLGATPISIATIAMQLGRRLLGDLSEANVLIVGAGEMCETAAVLAAERQPRRLAIVNRSIEGAERLARLTAGIALKWQDLEAELLRADLIVTGTGAREPVITRDMLDEAGAGRQGRRAVIIDIGVPRDVEPNPNCTENVFVYSIDDLQQIAGEHLQQRLAEVPRAEDVVSRALEKYLLWLDTLAVVPTIVDLRDRFETLRQFQVKHHISKIHGLDERGIRRVEQLTQAIVNSILHDPLVRLKARSTDDTGRVLAESLRYLFALDDKEGEA